MKSEKWKGYTLEELECERVLAAARLQVLKREMGEAVQARSRLFDGAVMIGEYLPTIVRIVRIIRSLRRNK